MGEDYYEILAQQERLRQREIARSYLNATPSIGNLYNAAQAFWNSLPIVGINSIDVNPFILTGMAPTPGRTPMKSSALRVRNPYSNYVSNPAERAAAQDFIKDLKETGQYLQFMLRNPGYKIQTAVEDGVSEDWSYPYETMVKHGLRMPRGGVTRPAQPVVQPKQQIVPKKTAQLRSRDYYREKVEDRNQGVYKRQRREFGQQQMLYDGDARHVNPGRPPLWKLRLADENIQNYSSSALREYHKLKLKAAKKGYNNEEILHLPQIKDFLRNLIETEGHIW